MSESKSSSETFDINAPFKIDLSNANGTRRDNTLLAKMGFSDPDRQNPIHDLACQYLAQEDVGTALVKLLLKGGGSIAAVAIVDVRPEFRITKGEYQYQTTIGFADLILEFRFLLASTFFEERQRQWELRLATVPWAETKLCGAQSSCAEAREIVAKRKSDYAKRCPDSDTASEWNCEHLWLRDDEERLKRQEDIETGWVKRIGELHSESYDALSHADQTEVYNWLKNNKSAIKDLVKAKLEELDKKNPHLQWNGNGWTDDVSGVSFYGDVGEVLVEVKTGGTSASDSLRQMRLYTDMLRVHYDYRGRTLYAVLVTTYDLSVPDVEMLRSGKVTHLCLGKAFADYCQRCREAPRAASPEI